MSEALYEIKNEYGAYKCFRELIALKQPTVQQNIQNTIIGSEIEIPLGFVMA